MDLGTRMRYALIHATRGYFSANHDNIVSDYDLPYYEGEDFFDRKHRLNVHYHAPLLKSGCPKEADVSLEESTQADKKLPVVVFIHGGGWKRGDRNYFFDAYNNVGKAIAAQGFVCVVPSYRLSSPGEGDVKHPHHAYDVACALYAVGSQPNWAIWRRHQHGLPRWALGRRAPCCPSGVRLEVFGGARAGARLCERGCGNLWCLRSDHWQPTIFGASSPLFSAFH